MYQLYGFMVINSLIDNALDRVSKIGELSDISRTFSSEIGVYSDEHLTDVRLHTFYSFEDDVKVPLKSDLAREVMVLGQWVAQQAITNRIIDNRDAFIQTLKAEFKDKIKLDHVGKIITDGRYFIPERIEFSLLADTRENRYHIWFVDESFQTQYDKFELKIIPQLQNVDDFFKSPDKVKRALTENMNEQMVKRDERVNEIANSHPYTMLLSYNYDWYNPEKKDDIVPSLWTVLLYGKAANNADLIKETISSYVLSQSDYDRTRWEKLLPDLFIPTEFYLCPTWTKFSTPNLQTRGGLHSPIVPYREVIPWALKTMYGYEEKHLMEHAVVFDSIFKSIGVVACGHKQNRLAPVEFEKLWPEYANIYTTSLDFNRLSPETQDFIMLMNEMFVQAETFTPTSEIPKGYTRVKRGEYYYLTRNMNGITYIVPLRWNFINEIALTDSAISLPTVNPTGSAKDEEDRITDVIDMTPNITDGSETHPKPNKPSISLDNGDSDGGIAVTPGTKPRPNKPKIEYLDLDTDDVGFVSNMVNTRTANNDMFAERKVTITINNIPRDYQDKLNLKLIANHFKPNDQISVETYKDGKLNTWTIQDMPGNPDKVKASTVIRMTSNTISGNPLPYVDGFTGPYTETRATPRFMEGEFKLVFTDPNNVVEQKELMITQYSVTTQLPTAQ